LELNSIEGFSDLCVKLVACFSISIHAKKNSTGLFCVAQQEEGFTRAYLKRFNEKMFKVKELIEPMTIQALIRRVSEHAL
jgi:hypothetical protein